MAHKYFKRHPTEEKEKRFQRVRDEHNRKVIRMFEEELKKPDIPSSRRKWIKKELKARKGVGW